MSPSCVANTGPGRATFSLVDVWSVLNSSFGTNAVSALPPFTTTQLGLGSSLDNGSELELVVKPFGYTVISTSSADATLVEVAAVVVGSILSSVKGTGSVLVMDILDPIVVLFDDISTVFFGNNVSVPVGISDPDCCCPLFLSSKTAATRMARPAPTTTAITVPTIWIRDKSSTTFFESLLAEVDPAKVTIVLTQSRGN